jgi:branched-chain amino acid transport system substrate-binding protein
MDRAAKMRLEEENYEIDGMKLRYVNRDSETKAGAATRRFKEAIESEDVKFAVGPWSSGVALAASEVAKNNKVMHWFSGGTEDISGKRCHRYSFMWAANAWTAMNACLKGLKDTHPDVKRLYLFVVDYAFGWSLQKYVESLAGDYDMEVVGVDRHPLGHREYSSYITKAAAAEPDAIYMINFGLDAISAARQIYNFGLTPDIPLVLSWSSGVEELIQMDPGIRENMIVGTNFYYTADTPKAKQFVEAYQNKFGNPPGYAPSASYALMNMTLEGMRRAGSTDVKEVITALEGATIDDIVGQTKVRAENHQAIRPYYVLKCKQADAMEHEFDFADILLTDSTPQPDEINECEDIGTL